MNISEEKKYIYDMMRTVVDERRTLTDIYFSLKERLNDLDELERKGLSDLSIKGYVDLQNERNQQLMLENTQRELAHLKQKLENEQAKPKEEAPASSIPAFAIAEQKFKDNNKIVKNTKKRSQEKKEKKPKRPKGATKRVHDMIFKELKERSDTAFNASEMYDILLREQFFRDLNFEMADFRSNMFFRVVTRNTDVIQKVGTGRYQYIGSDL